MVGPEISRRLPVYENLKLSYWQFVNAFVFLGVSMTHNYLRRRPFQASVPKHLAAAVAGFLVGIQFDKFVEKRRNTRVQILEDYIARHPADFPVATPLKYKDVLHSWAPTR